MSTLAPTDCSVSKKRGNHVVIGYEDSNPSGPATITPYSQGNGVVLMFRTKNFYHDSKPIPADLWNNLDTSGISKLKFDGFYWRVIIKDGHFKRVPEDFYCYFNN